MNDLTHRMLSAWAAGIRHEQPGTAEAARAFAEMFSAVYKPTSTLDEGIDTEK